MGASTILPANLYPGIVSIYGAGSISGMRGLGSIKFGIVNQVYSCPTEELVGQSVMFNSINADKVYYGNDLYYMLPENKIILIEEVPP